MKKQMILVVFLSLVLMITSACATEDPLKKGLQDALNTFAKGCEQELSTYCKDVIPGEGRILACLYAFQDKLSPNCEYALYDSMNQLERSLSNVSFAINECRNDLKTYCSGNKPGEGRLLDCLNHNEEKVSDRCNSALKVVGFNK